ADNMLSFDEVNSQIWSIGAEVFAPCAASRIVTKDQVNQMIEHGLEVIASGANVPFADKEIFFGSIMEHADQNISLIPDFISNCGMARAFAYFMGEKVQMTDEAIFNDTSITIKNAIQDIKNKNSDLNNISKTAFGIALEKLL
ncbi:MAG: amino acid dehydrogenase, partial [Flavobacteriaceae bacterium]